MGEAINVLSFGVNFPFQIYQRKNAFPEEFLALLMQPKCGKTEWADFSVKKFSREVE